MKKERSRLDLRGKEIDQMLVVGFLFSMDEYGWINPIVIQSKKVKIIFDFV